MDAEAHLFATYGPAVTRAALPLLVNPRRWIHRIAETFEAKDDIVRCEVNMHFTVPVPAGSKATTDRVIVPFTYTQRGALIDNLEVFDSAGRNLPVLCHEEHEEFAHLLLEALVLQSARVQSLASLTRAAREPSQQLIRIPLMAPGDAEAAFRRVFDSEQQDRYLTRLRESKILYEFSRLLISNYIVLTELSAGFGSRQIIRYSYDSAFDEFANRGLSATIGLWLGHRPFSFRFVVPNLDRCESYHFRMPAPDGHFVARQGFLEPMAAQSRSARARSETLPLQPVEFPQGVLYVGEDAVGAPYAHLYKGGASKSSDGEIFARAIFYERPPGVLGVSIGLAALMLATLAAFLSNAKPLLAQGAFTDAPSILLAIPGAVVVWVRSWVSKPDAFLQAPLRAWFILLSTGLFSISSAIMLVVARAAAGPAAAAWIVPVWWTMVALLAILAIAGTVGLTRSMWLLRRGRRL